MLSVQSKDPKVQDLQLEQKHLSISANLTAVDVVGGLKAASSEAASIVAISGVLATRSIAIDVKEPVMSVQKVQVINKATGEIEPLLSAAVIAGNIITVTCDGTGLSDACIEVLYRN
jgi:hypothetical protein